ncbi:unnamed protein product [Closterium sp. NIES-53]
MHYFLARELQQCGQLRLAYVATRANTADIFTKALLPACFDFLDWSWCMRRSWAMDLAHVVLDNLAAVVNGVNVALPIDLDEDIGDVGLMIARLGLGPSAMPAAAFVAIVDDQPTCAELGKDPLALEPAAGSSDASWEAPTTMQTVYVDENPESRAARRYARATSEMLIGYARATGITPRNLCTILNFGTPSSSTAWSVQAPR